ncbi:MAG: hypothetical protein R2751_19200 [Bacteroidales bacterium]
MKNFLAFLILILCAAQVHGQFHQKEVGLRGGYTAGANFRVTIAENLSYEAQLGFRNQGLIGALYRQQHQNIGMDRLGNWDFIYGFGVHAGFYFTDSYRIFYREVYYGRDIFTPVAGVGAYLGVEYQMVDYPVSFGVSYLPHMEMSLKQLFGINLWDFGLTVRYRF